MSTLSSVSSPQGAAQQFGVLTLSYASANETPTIQLVRVHKPDGTTVDTPPADAMDMPAAVSREAPLYSDLKEKHLPVRSLSVGDTLEYEARFAIDKAEAPGQFWGAHHFTVPGSVIVLNETLTVEVPANKYVQVWSPNHKPTVSDHDGLRTYAWTVSQLIPPAKANADDDTAKSTTPKDPDEDADGRKLPSVAWTTFHSWAEVGDWYRSLALSQSQPNDALRARADELTKDAKTPDDQIRALYDFVSTKTRYIGIDFGVGRYQPHSAAEVLANQYGDCKDKDTLLEALLHAKGFTTAPLLSAQALRPCPTSLHRPSSITSSLRSNSPPAASGSTARPPYRPTVISSRRFATRKHSSSPPARPPNSPPRPPPRPGPSPRISPPMPRSTPTANSPATYRPPTTTTMRSSSALLPSASHPPSGTEPRNISPP
jgi:hypothetical protein